MGQIVRAYQAGGLEGLVMRLRQSRRTPVGEEGRGVGGHVQADEKRKGDNKGEM